MKAILASSLSLAATVAGTMAVTSTARAEDPVVVERSPKPTIVETNSGLPNSSLLRGGVFTLGISYLPALIVAIESDREADDHLYAPVVGPWLDLAARGDCEGDCDSETINKVLLVTDGVFQGIGALQILGAFVFPETRAVTIAHRDGTQAVSFTVTPAKIAGANGLLATGEF
jgi:hypothetical protein